MKKITFTLLMLLSLLLAQIPIACAETEEEMRTALQETLMRLNEQYGAELLPAEQRQLSFLTDWADRYTNSEEWDRFARDFMQCTSAKQLSALLQRDYIGITQAEEGNLQRKEIQERCVEIVQAAGFSIDDMPYVSLGCKEIRNYWEAIVSQIPGEERRTPGFQMDLTNEGNLNCMEYCGEIAETAPGDAAISAEEAQAIGFDFLSRYVYPHAEASAWTCDIKTEDSLWRMTCQSRQNEEDKCEIMIGAETGAIYLVDTFKR